jgi:hypothetical protein
MPKLFDYWVARDFLIRKINIFFSTQRLPTDNIFRPIFYMIFRCKNKNIGMVLTEDHNFKRYFYSLVKFMENSPSFRKTDRICRFNWLFDSWRVYVNGILTFRRYFSFWTSVFLQKIIIFKIRISDVRNKKNTDVRNDHRKKDGYS